MKMRLGIATATLALTASFASAEGINLSWNDCGLAGTQNATFACDANTGAPFTLVASFLPPAGVDEFLGISSQLDIFTEHASLPDWWKHGNSQCRGTSGLVVNFNFTSGPFTCADFYVGQAAGGFAYDVGFGSPSRARLRVQCAVPIDNSGPIDSSTEYYGYKVDLLLAKTTGTGSCTGCTSSACFVLNEVQLFQPPGALNDPQIVNPADRSFATWQPPTSGPSGCPLATATRNTTWGTLKSLYR